MNRADILDAASHQFSLPELSACPQAGCPQAACLQAACLQAGCLQAGCYRQLASRGRRVSAKRETLAVGRIHCSLFSSYARQDTDKFLKGLPPRPAAQ